MVGSLGVPFMQWYQARALFFSVAQQSINQRDGMVMDGHCWGQNSHELKMAKIVTASSQATLSRLSSFAAREPMHTGQPAHKRAQGFTFGHQHV